MFANLRNSLKYFGINLFGAIPDFTKGFRHKGVEVTALAADLNKVAGVSAQGAILPRTAVVALGAADTAGGVLAWANPAGVPVVVTDVVIDTTTKSTGASTVDVGIAADGTTANDTVMDGLDTGTAAGLFNHVTNKGTNGVGKPFKLTAAQFITASKASGACAGLVGKAYITYYVA